MASEPATVLVWGATPSDTSPLFPDRETLNRNPAAARGPEAGAFRISVRDMLRDELATLRPPVSALFSEDWDTFGHMPENPGLYEPLQLEQAAIVVLLLPGPRSLAVNTWELALALENGSDGKPVFLDKLVILLPETVYHYVRAVFRANVADPKDFRMRDVTGTPEPALGAANSFAARWLVLAIRQRYAGSDPWARISAPMPIGYYPDSVSWELRAAGDTNLTPTARETIAKISDLVQSRLPLP